MSRRYWKRPALEFIVIHVNSWPRRVYSRQDFGLVDYLTLGSWGGEV